MNRAQFIRIRSMGFGLMTAGLMTVALPACVPSEPVRGEWNVSFTVISDDADQYGDPVVYESFTGGMVIHQFLDLIDGEGVVQSSSGNKCNYYFVFEGHSYDESKIPVALEFTNNDCGSAGTLSGSIDLDLYKDDAGNLLLGHGAYEPISDSNNVALRLYFSASIAPYGAENPDEQ